MYDSDRINVVCTTQTIQRYLCNCRTKNMIGKRMPFSLCLVKIYFRCRKETMSRKVNTIQMSLLNKHIPRPSGFTTVTEKVFINYGNFLHILNMEFFGSLIHGECGK